MAPLSEVCTNLIIPYTIQIAPGMPVGTTFAVKQQINGGGWTQIATITTTIAGQTSATFNASIPFDAVAEFTADVDNTTVPCAIPDHTDTITVVDHAFPTPVISFDGSELSYTNIPLGWTGHYRWQKKVGASWVNIGSQDSPACPVTTNGEFRVEATNGGCVESSSPINVTNVGVQTLDFPNQPVTVYPNPTADVVHFE